MNHKAINQRIQALESELAGLKAELAKPEKFEFNYTKTEHYMINYYGTHKNMFEINKDYLKNFRYRQTKANAEADFQLQKELMCIGALAEQIDPNYKYKIDFSNVDSKYMVLYNYPKKTYVVSSSYEWRTLGVVYMPKDVAEKVCEILNNKQVEL